MKFILPTMALMMMSYNAMAQNYNVKITSTEELKAKKMYLLSLETRETIDSASISNNTCTFKGNIQSPIPVVLSTDKNGRNQILPFTLDNQNTTISISGMSPSISGSETNNRYNEILTKINKETAILNSVQAEADVLAKKYNKNLPDTTIARLDGIWNQSVARYTDIVKSAINENKDNFIPVFYLNSFGENLEPAFIENFLNEYKYKDNKSLNKVYSMLETAKRKAVGSMFTDITLKDSKGASHKLSDYAGKGNYVLVDFWASWCGPCRAEMPHVKEVYEKYKDKGFEIVGISLDNNQKAWERSIKQMGMTWHQFSDLKGWDCEAVKIYGIKGIPATILIGPDGKIAATDLRGEQLSETLAEIYK